ncbi:putative SKP1/BTB/POZ domain superfamily protein [Septoria linicola]|nr:putative SKP1/BTB/POZ domain superfamily protein [Septoria linicola]
MTEPTANRDMAYAALTSPLITIRIGENVGDRSKHFFVQQNILCKTSQYMQARCKPEWSQDSEIIHLPNTTSQVVDLYVDWLYHEVVHPSKYAELEEISKAYFVLGT